MSKNQQLVDNFLDDLKPEKFYGFQDKQYTICTDHNLGLRLDHQGLNKDKATKPHRLYVQPLGNGKTKKSVRDSGTVLA